MEARLGERCRELYTQLKSYKVASIVGTESLNENELDISDLVLDHPLVAIKKANEKLWRKWKRLDRRFLLRLSESEAASEQKARAIAAAAASISGSAIATGASAASTTTTTSSTITTTEIEIKTETAPPNLRRRRVRLVGEDIGYYQQLQQTELL